MAGLDTVPPEQRAGIDHLYEKIVNEAESLKEFRRLSKLPQAEITETPRSRQPDIYLPTLRSYV